MAADPDDLFESLRRFEFPRKSSAAGAERPGGVAPRAGGASRPGSLTAEILADRRLAADLRRAEVEQDETARPYADVRRELGLG